MEIIENKHTGCSISDTLNLIVTLQRNTMCSDLCAGCDKPFLGPNTCGIMYNTRPVTLYACCTGELWTMPYTLNGTAGTSTVFKVENVECNCATFRVLAPNPNTEEVNTPYVLTTVFFTIDLDCVLALQCLSDTYTS